MRVKILVTVVAITVMFLSCGHEIIPESGKWTADEISFYVSTDSEKLTRSGSTLEEGASLIVEIPIQSNPYGVIAMTFYRYIDIPIDDGSFSFEDDDIKVDGEFFSETTASGTASAEYHDSYYNYIFKGSIIWDALP